MSDLGGESNGSPGTEDEDSAFLPSVVRGDNKAIVESYNKKENTLWNELLILKSQQPTHENKIQKKESYLALAHHYLQFNGYEAAVRLIKNALQEQDDANLRLQLSRIQAEAGDREFILHYEKILKQNKYQIKLALEYCYYLEKQGFHSAAVNILANQIAFRATSSDFPEDEGVIIAQFLNMLNFIVIDNQHIIIDEYRHLIAAGFPNEIAQIAAPQLQPSQLYDDYITDRMAGFELEEYESEYGIKDEIKTIFGYMSFLISHYPVQLLIGFGSLLLVVMSMLRIDAGLIQRTGDFLCLLMILLLSFEMLRSFRLVASLRRRAWMKISNIFVFSSMAVLALSYLAPKVLGNSGSFISPVMAKVVSLVLVAAIVGRFILASSAIKSAAKKLKDDIIFEVTRRSLRRQVAGLVWGTSKWTLILSISNVLFLSTHATLLLSLYVVAHSLFLLTTWRWAFLEVKSLKQKLRDQMVFVLSILFGISVYLLYMINNDLSLLVVGASIDACIMLGILVCYIFQFSQINKRYVYVLSIIFILLNFAPVIDWVSFAEDLQSAYGNLKSEVFAATSAFQLIALIFFATLVMRRNKSGPSQTIYQENVMGSAYKINAVNVGTVGEHNTVGNVSQHTGNVGAAGEHNLTGSNNQQSQQADMQIDLPSLADELADIRAKLSQEISEPEHYHALSQVLAAEKAARAGDESKTLEILKNVGVWFWEAGNKIGIGVATAAVKSYLGV
ncbi:MAG: hypothetical protein WAP03_25035 [Methylorubrum rhodinum]|uniref:tetratricopeptide repeat protein n=1 Tax=Methylorubrum rhodinum TaxID=29428 RepID=UPI003BAEE381